jgi:hypothetical protein
VVDKVLFVVDGSVPPSDAATLAHGLLPNAAEVVIVEVVPQLPLAWNAWPAFPNAAEDLAQAWTYVSEVAQGLAARGWKVGTRVQFSPLSAAELDREVLKLTETLLPDLICLALKKGKVRASIVRESVMPVLVAKPGKGAEEAAGRGRLKTLVMEPALMSDSVLMKPAGALIFRQAGIL